MNKILELYTTIIIHKNAYFMSLNRKMNFCGYCNVISCMTFETILLKMEQIAGGARNVSQWKLGKVTKHLVSLYIL